MEKVFKVLDCEVKKLEDRVYEFTASTSTQDRDGEVIEPLGWDLKNFKKNPVIMYAHDYRSLPVGKAPRVWVSNGTLKNTVEFPPEGTYEFADIVERLVNTGYLKTESVGFIPKKWEDGDGEKAPRRTYTKQELLEISIVPVPSNPDALRNAITDGVITVKEFGALTEPEAVDEGITVEDTEAVTKPEETDDFIRIPVAECDVTATIDISKKEGIKALYCGEEKKVKTYLFDKRDPYNWTMSKAKKWVEEHKEAKQETYKCECIECGHKVESEKHCKDLECPKCGGKMRREERPGPGQEAIEEIEQKEIPEEKTITQEALKDELDYTLTSIQEVGLSDEAMEGAMALVSEILERSTGSDIPEEILAKVGAVLNQKNRDRLESIKAIAQQILDSAGKPEQEAIEPEVSPKEAAEEIARAVAQEFRSQIDKLQGKV